MRLTNDSYVIVISTKTSVECYSRDEAGWLKVPLLGVLNRSDADAPAPNFHPYPSGYRLPYHFNHPITGA